MINYQLIIGNWKMNPSTLDEAKRIAQKIRRVATSLDHTEVVVCPPVAFISAITPKNKDKTFSIGAQSVSYEEVAGAHTGEVSADMLRDLDVRYVIVGHSERRSHGETDLIVSRKVKAVFDAGLTPIVCVGEKERDDGGNYFDKLKEQIKNSLAGIPKKYGKNIILAYEPLWAIGGKLAMEPHQVFEMLLFVKKVFADIFGQESAMKMKVLYGGTVNFRNATDIVKIGRVNGLLVGRESLNVPGFVELMRAIDDIKL